MDALEHIVSAIPYTGIFRMLRAVFIALDVALFLGFLYALVMSWDYRQIFDFGGAPRKRVFTLRVAIFAERWQTVLRRFNLGSPEAMRIAVMEADALVDDALKQLGLPGEHMADRLQNIHPEEVASLNALWRAHRLRNDLVHTPGFSATADEMQTALNGYEAFLKEIGAL